MFMNEKSLRSSVCRLLSSKRRPMKKLFLTLLLSIICMTHSLFSGEAIVLKVKVPVTSVYTEPDTYSSVVKQIPMGTLLEAVSKLGDWYEIVVTDETGTTVSAYIPASAVEVVSIPVQPEAQEIRESYEGVPSYPIQPGRIPSGFFLKFGVIDKGYGDWIGSLGYDLRIMKNLSVGLEVMPAYYSFTDVEFQVDFETFLMDQSTMLVRSFLNVKGGTDLRMIRPQLDFAHIYGGIGGGLEADYTKNTIEQTTSKFSLNPALHIFGGIELRAKFVNLIFEYQLIRVLDPDLDPDNWIGYLIFGIRL